MWLLSASWNSSVALPFSLAASSPTAAASKHAKARVAASHLTAVIAFTSRPPRRPQHATDLKPGDFTVQAAVHGAGVGIWPDPRRVPLPGRRELASQPRARGAHAAHFCQVGKDKTTPTTHSPTSSCLSASKCHPTLHHVVVALASAPPQSVRGRPARKPVIFTQGKRFWMHIATFCSSSPCRPHHGRQLLEEQDSSHERVSAETPLLRVAQATGRLQASARASSSSTGHRQSAPDEAAAPPAPQTVGHAVSAVSTTARV